MSKSLPNTICTLCKKMKKDHSVSENFIPMKYIIFNGIVKKEAIVAI